MSIAAAFSPSLPVGTSCVRTTIQSISRTPRSLRPIRDSKLCRGTRSASMPTAALYGWIRKMVTGSGIDDPTTATLNQLGAHWHHEILDGRPLLPPDGQWAPPLQQATFGLGCFWGAERKFWEADGVYTTSVGYAGGKIENPTYRSVCSGRTGHAEVVNVVFDSTKTSYKKMLDVFWSSHDPTTKNRQGNDTGTQYRSAIYYYDDEQRKLAEATRDHFDEILKNNGRGPCTTEIEPAPEYFIAEQYHQQYLHKNPYGYCGLGGTGLYQPPQ